MGHVLFRGPILMNNSYQLGIIIITLSLNACHKTQNEQSNIDQIKNHKSIIVNESVAITNIVEESNSYIIEKFFFKQS